MQPFASISSKSRSLAALDFITTLAPFAPSILVLQSTKSSGKEPTMWIIGCDFHPGFEEVAMLDDQSGEIRCLRLGHVEEARQFYGSLAGPVRVGIEACGQSQWFERMLAELGHELWIGDAAQIRASVGRGQKAGRGGGAALL